MVHSRGIGCLTDFWLETMFHLANGPSKADVNQMLLYGQAYGAARVILVYPWHEAVGEQGTHRRWTVTGPVYDFETATVNVGYPAQVPQDLRGLFE